MLWCYPSQPQFIILTERACLLYIWLKIRIYYQTANLMWGQTRIPHPDTIIWFHPVSTQFHCIPKNHSLSKNENPKSWLKRALTDLGGPNPALLFSIFPELQAANKWMFWVVKLTPHPSSWDKYEACLDPSRNITTLKLLLILLGPKIWRRILMHSKLMVHGRQLTIQESTEKESHSSKWVYKLILLVLFNETYQDLLWEVLTKEPA